MTQMWATTLAAAVVATVAGTTPAFAQQMSVSGAPATATGAANCQSKFAGSFLDVGRGECWKCPPSHPNRTVFSVTSDGACERPAREEFRKASGPENPTGLLGTDCRSGYFFDVGKRKCYSCSGYTRTAYGIDHARACSLFVPIARARATRVGAPGCAAGSFKHGLTDRCYSCPNGYVRNAVIEDDLTKVNACTRITNLERQEAREKFERHKSDHPQTRANLARSAEVMKSESGCQEHATNCAPKVSDGDTRRRNEMVRIITSEIENKTGFDVVTWVVSGGGSLGVGFMHATGYAMTISGNAYQCRKVWTNSFTGGAAVRGGAFEEISVSPGGLNEGTSQSNGWQVGLGALLVGGYGLHWDAKSGEMTATWSFGFTPGGEISIGEYVHTWAETGKEVPCAAMTWGDGWKDL